MDWWVVGLGWLTLSTVVGFVSGHVLRWCADQH